MIDRIVNKNYGLIIKDENVTNCPCCNNLLTKEIKEEEEFRECHHCLYGNRTVFKISDWKSHFPEGCTCKNEPSKIWRILYVSCEFCLDPNFIRLNQDGKLPCQDCKFRNSEIANVSVKEEPPISRVKKNPIFQTGEKVKEISKSETNKKPVFELRGKLLFKTGTPQPPKDDHSKFNYEPLFLKKSESREYKDFQTCRICQIIHPLASAYGSICLNCYQYQQFVKNYLISIKNTQSEFVCQKCQKNCSISSARGNICSDCYQHQDLVRYYLNVPYDEKEQAKSQYGAKWDPHVKKWWINGNTDTSSMPENWLKSNKKESSSKTPILYSF